MRRLLAIVPIFVWLTHPNGCLAESLHEPRFLLACVPCHGFDGRGHSADVPHLAGQPEQYLYNQLVAFRQGQRKHPIMTFFSTQMTQQELQEIVEYYSNLKSR